MTKSHSAASAPPGSRPGATEVPPPADPGVVGIPSSPELVDDPQLQQLWLGLLRRPWRSLAVVSATKGIATLDVAQTLAKMASWYTDQPTRVLDLRDLGLRLAEDQLREIASNVKHAERVFLALRSTPENPTAALAARAADAAVLCVELGKTSIDDAVKTAEAVGRAHFLGTILVSGAESRVAPNAKGQAPEAADPSRGAKARPRGSGTAQG